MTRISTALALLGVGFLVGWQGRVESALAGVTRMTGATCKRLDLTTYTSESFNPTAGSSSGSLWGDVYCVLEDDSSLVPRASILSVVIDGRKSQPSSNVIAQACVKFYAATGFSCGASLIGPSAVGDFSISPSVTSWTTYPADFAYIYVSAPDDTSVRGYWIND